jgi:ATP-dependent Clp protease ATP-binding subunit ClpA
MFERFGQDARRAVVRAHEEAAAAGQGETGCEHLLLGLLAAPGPAAAAMTAAGLELTALRSRLPQASRAEPDALDALDADALASVGIDLDQVRRAADATFGPGALDRARRAQDRRAGRMRLTADAKKALALALQAAVGLRHRELTGGHLLIGIIDQGRNGALDLLSASAADPAALRADAITRLAEAA